MFLSLSRRFAFVLLCLVEMREANAKGVSWSTLAWRVGPIIVRALWAVWGLHLLVAIRAVLMVANLTVHVGVR